MRKMMTTSNCGRARWMGGLALALVASQAAAQQQDRAAAATPAMATQSLPNGATSITETFDDWTVSCAVDNTRKSCGLSQAQGNKQSGQRTFAIELRQSKDGAAAGTILMPFGLKLEAGALLKLDDKDVGHGLRFSTCVPQGCLLPITLPSVVTDAMGKGKTLKVAALDLSSGQATSFDISLKGFAAALHRIGQLDE